MKHAVVFLSLAAIIALAAFLRLYNIQNYPPGLFPDQAANGEDALLILDGDMRPFYTRGNGREALFFYMQAASIYTFGIGVWQMFLVSALVGTATVTAMYFATRPYFGRLAGLLAAYFLATSHWHITLSRTGFRAVQIPLFVALFTAGVGYTILAVKRSQAQPEARKYTVYSYIAAAIAGASFAGGFYTYIAYRTMVGVVLGVLFLLLIAALHPKIGFPHFRRYGKQVALGIIMAILVFLPLGLYFYEHPQDFFGRAGQVSIFSPDLQREVGGGTLLGTLEYSTRETLLSFFIGEGDSNWRHSVPGYPLLNPLVGVLFLLGLAWAIQGTVMVAWNIIRGREIHLGMIYPYVILLLVGMLLPVITTAEGMPHALRSVGLIAPIFMLSGAAGAVVLWWIRRQALTEISKVVLYGLAAGMLIVSGLYGAGLYFFVAGNDSEAAYAYRADLTDISEFIRQYRSEHPDQARPYLSLDDFSVQTVHFLLSVAAHDHNEHPDEAQHLYTLVKPETSEQVVLQPGEIIIFTQTTLPDADRFESVHGTKVKMVEQRFNRFGQEIMRVYQGVGAPAGPGVTEFDLDA